jgi:hypothetical protein
MLFHSAAKEATNSSLDRHDTSKQSCLQLFIYSSTKALAQSRRASGKNCRRAHVWMILRKRLDDDIVNDVLAGRDADGTSDKKLTDCSGDDQMTACGSERYQNFPTGLSTGGNSLYRSSRSHLLSDLRQNLSQDANHAKCYLWLFDRG